VYKINPTGLRDVDSPCEFGDRDVIALWLEEKTAHLPHNSFTDVFIRKWCVLGHFVCTEV